MNGTGRASSRPPSSSLLQEDPTNHKTTWGLAQHAGVRHAPNSARRTKRGYTRAVKVHEVVGLIEQDGWQLSRTKGSYRQYKHPGKPGLVTVPGKPGDDLAPGTLNSILKQEGLKE